MLIIIITKKAKVVDGSTLTLYGNVDIRDVVLGFRVSGRIATLVPEEGDQVKAGDVIAGLDKKPFQQELELRQAELAQALILLDNASKIFQRREKLIKRGAVSQSDYDNALAERDAAKASVDRATAQVELAQINLNDSEIQAPNDGVILTRIREKGAIVNAGQPVYTLALDNPVWVRTFVDEPDLGKIYPGQSAEVATDSGDHYQGTVGFISPQAEFTPKTVQTTSLRTDLVYRLRIYVSNPDQGLRQGMPVTVSIEKREQSEQSDNTDRQPGSQ